MSKGEELFSKNGLRLKDLNKMSKEERISQIEVNLQQLVEYFFFDFHHKEERDFRPILVDLVLNKKLFLKPLMKIYKEDKNLIPVGTGMMLWDCARTASFDAVKAINSVKESNILESQKEESITQINETVTDMQTEIKACIEILCEKQIKKMRKLGIEKEFAIALSPLVIDNGVMNGSNLFRFVPKITNWIFDVYESSLKEDPALEGKKVSTMGIDLLKGESMKKFMEVITKSLDLPTFGDFLKHLFLEKRDVLNHLTKEQIGLWNSLTAYALESLDSKGLFNGKSRISILKAYGSQIVRDEKRGRGGKRRVNFAELDEDIYPRIVKAYKSIADSDK